MFEYTFYKFLIFLQHFLQNGPRLGPQSPPDEAEGCSLPQQVEKAREAGSFSSTL